MRHIGRTHGISVSWMHERFSGSEAKMHYCPTDKQCADIFTKAFDNLDKWTHARMLISVVPTSRRCFGSLLELHDYSRVLADDPNLRKKKDALEDNGVGQSRAADHPGDLAVHGTEGGHSSKGDGDTRSVC